MRSARRILFDIAFLSIHIGKWVAGIFIAVEAYLKVPGAFWALVFLFLGAFIMRDLYRVFKAVIKDTTLDDLDSEGEKSYLKGIDYALLREAKTQVLVYLAVFTIGVVGISNNVSQWKEDGQSRIGNILVLSLFAFGPVAVLVGQARKRE